MFNPKTQPSEILLKIVKPNCTIVRKEINDEDTLVCTAFGNPPEVDYAWSLKSENETLDAANAEEREMSSYLVLKGEFIETRIYRCVANNSVGTGSFCEIDVAGKSVYLFFHLMNAVQHSTLNYEALC